MEAQANTIADLTTGFNAALDKQGRMLSEQAKLIAKLAANADAHTAQLAAVVASVALLADADADEDNGGCGEYVWVRPTFLHTLT